MAGAGGDRQEFLRALAGHVLVSGSALVLGLVLAVPIAVLAVRSPRVRAVAMALVGLIQTIPSLALLALFYPLLLAVSALSSRVLGFGFPALGFLPSLLALALYALLPMLRNAVVGVLNVDPDVREAALGVGMTPWQMLWRVEAPLAAPIMMAGVRIAAVWVIGGATLSTSVGQTSLGDLIFSGLQTEDWTRVLIGCAGSAALAIAADQALALVERGLVRRSPARQVIGAVLLVAGGAVCLIAGGVGAAGESRYRLGAKNFSEQYILSELMRARLEAVGSSADVRADLGSAVAFKALAADEIDAYVDYSGTLWTTVLHHADIPQRAVLLSRLKGELRARYGVELFGALGFENAYALAMPETIARRLGVNTLSDLAPKAPTLVLGSDLEFLTRPEWSGVKAAYGLSFRNYRRFQPTFLYRAAEDGEADVISAFSSDGRVAADRLRLLADPKGALPPYDAVVLIAPARRGDRPLHNALRPLLGRISLPAMQTANYAVDRGENKASPATAARAMAREIGIPLSPP